MIKFFKRYVIEVKLEKATDMEKIEIYDFDSKLSIHQATYKEIIQVEAESDILFLLVREKNEKLVVYQLNEIDDNHKIELLLKRRNMF